MYNARFSIISWARLCGVAVILMMAACARQGRPPGGPVDETPPALVSVSPESLAVSVAVDAPLVFGFSEKLDRRGFRSNLRFAPERRLRGISFKGETVIVRPEVGWPRDTLVVWTLLPSLKDKHGVKLGVPVSGAFTTGDTIPQAWIRGQARGEDLKLKAVVAELRVLPAQGKRIGELWRMASANELGFFRLGPLEVPSGPFSLKVYFDKNGNGKRDEREPVAERDSLELSPLSPRLELGELQLIDLEAPVPFVLCFDAQQADSIAVKVTLRVIGVEDAKLKVATVDSFACMKTKLDPGEFRVGVWKDVNGDGRFGPTPDGKSEPFSAERDLTLSPATPESLRWAWPQKVVVWSEVDTMRIAPLPREIFAPEIPQGEVPPRD